MEPQLSQTLPASSEKSSHLNEVLHDTLILEFKLGNKTALSIFLVLYNGD